MLLLDQSPVGGRFADEPFLLDGGSLRATLSKARNQARLALPAGGRHSLVIPVQPVKTRRGGVGICEICIPTSPQTVVAMMPPNGPEWSPRMGAEVFSANGRQVRVFFIQRKR